MPRPYVIGIGLVCLCLYICKHYWIVVHFNFNYVDSDQPYMWAAWFDFASLHFYEPRFYGQNYNTHFEAIVAQLFWWVTKNPIYALALATHSLVIGFTLISALVLWCNDLKLQSILWLCFWLCMPAEYDLLCALPRGFVSGFPFLLPAVLLLVKSPSDFRRHLAVVIFTLGLFIHPGIILVVIPVMVYIYTRYNISWTSLLTDLGIFVLACLGCFLLLDCFYFIHPQYIQNDLKSSFSITNLFINIQQLDKLWAYLSLFFTSQALWLLLTLFAIWLISKQRARFYALGSVVALLLLSLSSQKSLEGSTWLFMPYSRLYIYLPVFMALGLCIISKPKAIIVVIVFIMSLCNSWYGFAYSFHESIQKSLNPDKWVGVRVYTNTQLKSTFNFYAKALKSYQCNTLCISSTHWLKNPVSYGLGPYCNTAKWFTTDGATEKRYWIRQQATRVIPKQFLYQSSNFTFKTLKPPAQLQFKGLDDFGLVYVYNNSLTLQAFQDWAKQYEP